MATVLGLAIRRPQEHKAPSLGYFSKIHWLDTECLSRLGHVQLCAVVSGIQLSEVGARPVGSTRSHSPDIPSHLQQIPSIMRIMSLTGWHFFFRMPKRAAAPKGTIADADELVIRLTVMRFGSFSNDPLLPAWMRGQKLLRESVVDFFLSTKGLVSHWLYTKVLDQSAAPVPFLLSKR